MKKSYLKRGVTFFGVIVLFAACDTVTYDQQLSEESNSGEAITSSWIENHAGSSALAHELNEVRKATQVYKDASVAVEEGYIPVNYVPEMGFHFVNDTLFAEDEDAEVELTEPPILVYYTTGNFDPADVPTDNGEIQFKDEEEDELLDWLENLRLGAVEYVHRGDDEAPGTPANYFSDEESPRNLQTTEEEGWEFVAEAGFTALHVWVHRNNPEGVFQPTNPTVR